MNILQRSAEPYTNDSKHVVVIFEGWVLELTVNTSAPLRTLSCLATGSGASCTFSPGRMTCKIMLESMNSQSQKDENKNNVVNLKLSSTNLSICNKLRDKFGHCVDRNCKSNSC